MDDARIPSSEQLMAEMGWLRRLARSLVRDAATADDVAQEAWLVATEQQPSDDRPLRPWLARVVVNLVRTRRRSDARRDQRDATYDTDRAVPTPAELVERVELQRMLADEVLALAEPYRSTVLLHFVEGLSNVDIARRLGIPDGTVRRRLKVALDQLRDALRKRTDQPKRGWLAALVPFAGMPAPATASITMGVLAMKKIIGIVVALVILLLAIGAGVVWSRRARTDESTGTTAATGSGATAKRGIKAADPLDPATLSALLGQARAPMRRIAGRVVYRGTPVPGARVRLGIVVTGENTWASVMPDSVPDVLHPMAEVTSGADGTFDFGEQAPAIFNVSASAKDRAAGTTRVTNANPSTPSDRLAIELGDCASRLNGVVADASGGGIAKARVGVAGLSGTESNADGTYSVCLTPLRALGTPRVNVRVDADGYGTIKEEVIAVGEVRRDFRLVPEAVLVGRVVTPDDRPVAGALVLAVPEPMTAVATGWSVADRDGRFRIDRLAPSTFELTAQAPDGIPSPVVAVVARATTMSQEIRLVIGTAGRARVRGHVFLQGAPFAGAEVTALHAGRVVSQADGSFELQAVPYGPTRFFAHPVQVEAPGEITIASPVVEDLRIEVSRLATVRGRVMRDGKPIAGADLVYEPAPQATFAHGPLAARGDANGAFTIDGLPAGPGRLFAWDNAGKAFSEWVSLDITAGETRTVDVELGFSGEVSGTVVDETGAPLASVYMRLDRADGSGDMCESMTDASGKFDCAMLVGGMYRPTVSPLPGGRQSFAPARGEQLDLINAPKAGILNGITIAVKNERVAIRGTVVDDTGAPVPDVRVDANGRGQSTMAPPSAMSDVTGRFVIENLARGSYDLYAKGADGGETRLPGVTAGGEPATIELARAGAIEGTLVGFTTTPMFFVNALNADRPVFGQPTVHGTTFSRIGLAPGRYTVEAHAGGQVDGQIVEVRPGGTTRITLRSRAIGTLEGTVSELGTRKPLAGMRCDARVSMDGRTGPAPPDVSQQAFTDSTGHFVVNAPVGRAQIFCFALEGGPLTPAGTDVEVTSTTRTKVSVFSVRANFGEASGDAGFTLDPLALPLIVTQVLPKGPAASAGLRVGDRLLTIDGVALDGVLPIGAITLIGNHRPRSTVLLGISRGGVGQTLKVLVGNPP